jgi:CRISPR-associated protein Cas1
VPVSYHTGGGWHVGTFTPTSGHNVITRIAQHRAAADPAASLALARAFVHAKVLNSRVMLRRNGVDVPAETLLRMQELAGDAERSTNIDQLLGIEGSAARFYFQSFGRMLKGELRERFAFDGRNRRPPKDPVNALLSFAYACLTRELTVITAGLGLDPYVGFMHQPRYGRASLALDLMEEFRPVLADSVVINAINNGVVGPEDFLVRPTGVALSDGARGRFIEVYERRMDEVATHPRFNTRLSYRRILELQARFLGKVLLGDLPEYPEYRIR